MAHVWNVGCVGFALWLMVVGVAGAADRPLFEDDVPAARTPARTPGGGDAALAKQVLEKLNQTQYNVWQHRVRDCQATYAVQREGETIGQAVVSCAGPGKPTDVRIEGEHMADRDKSRLPMPVEYGLNHALFYLWGGDMVAQKTPGGFRLQPREGGPNENVREISDTYHLTKAVMTAGEGRLEIDYVFQTLGGKHYLDTMTMTTSKGQQKLAQKMVFSYARQEGVPVVSKIKLTYEDPAARRVLAEYQLAEAKFRLTKAEDGGRFEGLTDDTPRRDPVARPDDGPARRPPGRLDPMDAIRAIGAWDEMTKEVAPRLILANLGGQMPLIYKSAQYTVNVQITPQAGEVTQARVNVSWEDVDGDGMLSDAEVTIDLVSVSSYVGRALMNDVIQRMRKSMVNSVPMVLANSTVKTRRQAGGYLMTVKAKGQDVEYNATVSSDFRLTQLEAALVLQGATGVTTFTYANAGGKWLLTETLEKITSRSGSAVTTTTIQYDQAGGVPVPVKVTNVKTTAALGARFGIREDFTSGKMTAKKREQPLDPLLSVAKAAGVDLAALQPAAPDDGGRVEVRTPPPPPRPDDARTPPVPDGPAPHPRPDDTKRRETNWLYYYTMAGMAINQGKYDQAMEHLKKGLAEDPDNPKLIGGRGDCHFKMEQYDKALADYSRVIELAPNSADGYTGRCAVYCRQAKIKEAYEDADKAVKVAPKDPEGYRLRALVGMYRLEYDPCWEDVKACRRLGGKVTDSFIKELERCSGKKDQ